jgi:PAS domain S-box-containing protein
VMMNRVAEELTGWPQAEALGQPMEEVLSVIDEESQSASFQSRDTLSMSGLLVARDGTERAISNSMAPIRDSASKIVGVVIVFRDITEQRRREEERVRATKLESVGILAGGIAHDFNNFLTAILGNIALARLQIRGDHKVADLLARSEVASRQARELTQQLLTFSMGGSPVKKAASARELIEECAAFALRGSNVRCDTEIDDDAHVVEIDRGQISQVIHNLIINADQAMPEGGVIKIRAQNVHIEPLEVPSLELGDYVSIAITDHGIGIAAQHHEKIFDPYFTTKAKGSGLGLATSYSIVKSHQGLITVQSELGIGTTFTVYLPAAAASTLVAAPAEEMEVAVGSGRVLVMDDDLAVRTVTEEMLRHMGYEVQCAEEGGQLVRLYRQAYEEGHPFDLVIMDLTIPGGMGGGEAVARVLAINPQAPVVVSSGYSNDPIMGDFKRYGFRAVLRKPFDFNDLSHVIDEVRQTQPLTEEGKRTDEH